ILERVLETKNRTHRTTEHRSLDALTGRPLLVTTTNAFDKPVFSYSFPARWAYDGMGSAAANVGLRVPTVGGGLVFPRLLAIPNVAHPSCESPGLAAGSPCIAFGDELVEWFNPKNAPPTPTTPHPRLVAVGFVSPAT